MGLQISPLFQAVEDQARRINRTGHGDMTWVSAFVASGICRRAAKNRVEINMFRSARRRMRENLKQDGSRNGHLLTGDIHPIEYQALTYLVPQLNKADAHEKKELWLWIMKQPWGKEFAAPEIEKTRF